MESIYLCDRDNEQIKSEKYDELQKLYNEFLKLNLFDIIRYKLRSRSYTDTITDTIYEFRFINNDRIYLFKVYYDKYDLSYSVYLYYYYNFGDFGYKRQIIDDEFIKSMMEYIERAEVNDAL